MSLSCSSVARIQNIARGILPTAASWDTAPTDLANATNGDPTTVTGTGSTVKGAAGVVGTINVDLGAPYYILFGYRVGMWRTANIYSLFNKVSLDGVTYSPSGAPPNYYMCDIYASAAAEEIHQNSRLCYARYLQLYFYVSAAATCSAKIYEIWALKMI